MLKDTTKYIFNGKEYGKGRLVLAIVKHYVDKFSPSFSELNWIFPADLQGSKGILINEQDLVEKNKIANDSIQRYFSKDSEALKTSDGQVVFVSDQWSSGNIGNILDKAKELKLEIEVLKGEIKSLDELFENYKANPNNGWIRNYKAKCKQLTAYQSKPSSDYDKEFLIELWKTPNNGVANVSPGALSSDEFDLLLDDLPEITFQIIHNPTPDTLRSVYSWFKEVKKNGKFKKIKWGVINRVFATANPDLYSTILNEEHLKKLVIKLNELFALEIELTSNWAQLNANLMSAIKAEGFQDEDVYLMNTFAWKLYEMFVKNDNVLKNKDHQPTTIQAPAKLCENIIYYGPPGTGKTFKLQKTLKDKYTDEAAFQDKFVWLTEHIDNLNWFEILVLILLDSNEPMKVPDIIAHEYFTIKAELNNRSANLKQTAWAALQTHAITDSKTVKYAKRVEPLIFDKTGKSLWFIADSEHGQLEEYDTLLASLKQGPVQTETIKRFEFVTFHQSYGYEEFIEGLRPVTNEEGDISYEVKPGVFKRLCKRAEANPEHQYALVIDEINRGNISKIFGELISLVEIDKRKGCDNELMVTLPYSGLPFTVPNNLDIIGTMNTADRSLTHIDVALRRRFEFKELRTDYSLISDDVDGINVKRMLYAINQRIELLLDREHILGHALLMKIRSVSELAHVFKTKVMPLLEEYFFENWDKINQVLNNNGFIVEQKDAGNIWLGSNDEYASKSFQINFSAFEDIKAYQKIYSGIDPSAFSDCEQG